MEVEDLIINSECDGLPLNVALFIPDDKIKGIIQISHGIGESKEKYYNFMKFMVKQGYVVIINDHRGTGRSVWKSEDVGYFYDNSSEYIVEDLHQIIKYVKSRFENKKVYLICHNAGAMIGMKYLKKYDFEIEKLVLYGLPSNNPFSNMFINLTEKIIGWIGDRQKSEFIEYFALRKNENSCNLDITLNGFKTIFTLLEEIYENKNWNLANVSIPIFFMADSKDPVIINKNHFIESKNFFNDIGYENIKCKIYDEYKYERFDEENDNLIYEDILNFIQESYKTVLNS